ncbi:MAG: DNA replication/repair protein RecF [Candidatus Peribacter sp.]|jgi:DNA replication and repair protein RecF|nr:DNA replication/repair protein RecF [Candidatus Peribacter sp.]MBT4392744.1 DNA replication/repair protein RecF [Candidatus Peribacter sp.]MBT4600639.1 DNA replication/repair protein RecF [Candidatus Peribacter sp.]MBT5148692.1 DNA replication/repair protein RecF [Candidatus Peribacter sp.]MBT5637713.1 DNA replication/repair protein RecF [Candidatus Peribacter sp.]
MRLTSISLQQFRSYSEHRMEFGEENVHVLVGPNGVGKTNILEAISLLSLTKSCQKADETDIMTWGTEFYRIKAQALTDGDEEKSLELVSQVSPRKQKACFINDVKVPINQMVGSLPTVIFLPQDLEIFTGAPARRRGFLDQLLCQVSPEYMQVLMQYAKVIKQRNSLLRKIAEGSARRTDLAVWDERTAETGTVVMLRRLELCEMLQCTFGQELATLGENWEDAQIIYERKGEARDFGTAKSEMMDLLSHFQNRDIVLQSTTIGPHRDDWKVIVDGRDISTFASRGQQRTAVLALLFLEVSYLELQRGEKPVILLDDVFSELDDHHQTSLLKSFEEHQVIITTTHIPSEVHGARIWEMKEQELVLSD